MSCALQALLTLADRAFASEEESRAVRVERLLTHIAESA